MLSLFGLLLPNMVVSIQGQSTLSSAQGTFSLAGISLPYDLAVSTDTLGDGALHVFADLDVNDPVVAPFFGEAMTPAASARTGTTSGDTSYNLQVAWSGSGNSQIRIHALHFEVETSELEVVVLVLPGLTYTVAATVSGTEGVAWRTGLGLEASELVLPHLRRRSWHPSAAP